MSKLVPCSACGAEIALNAEACPHCGSPNDWIHPKIQQFIEDVDLDLVRHEYRYLHEKEWIRIWVSRSTFKFKLAMFLMIASMLLILVMGVGAMIFTVIGVLLFAIGSNDNNKCIEVTLTDSGPRFETDDEKYFKDVIEFFSEEVKEAA